MSYVYYPSCNFQRIFPETAERIRTYLQTQADVRIAGCCHRTSELPGKGDVIVTVCMSCMHILEERRPDIAGISLPEFLLTRDDFQWPDLQRRKIVVQDCFRARAYHGLQDAVRECLLRMNASIIELPENRDETRYDGNFLFHEPYPQNIREAPNYFRDYLPEHLTIFPEDQWNQEIGKYAEALPAGQIAGYCNTCVKGLRDAGKDAVHLMELVFAAES